MFAVSFLFVLSLSAVEVEIDGINYDIIAKAKQGAIVIAKNSDRYSGAVVIPESVEYEGVSYAVTSIGDYAFNYCSGLTSVTIPNSVTSIGSSAFHDCYRLKEVHISDIAAWCNIEFGGSESNPLCYAHHLYLNGEEVTDLIIPEGVTAIKYYAFYYCSGLTSVTIPNSVTSIGSSAFHSCYNLTSVSIPNSVKNIENMAFYNCSGLTSIEIPNNLTSIGGYVFDNTRWYKKQPDGVIYINNLLYAYKGDMPDNTSVVIKDGTACIAGNAFRNLTGLTSVTIPNSVTSIGENAFAYCPELTDVYCYAEKVPSTESDAFEGSYVEYATLHVPTASMEDYKTTEPWSSFGKIVGLSGEGPEQPEVEKCATPVVTYAEGKLSFSCETEGAEFVTDITDTDIKKHYDAEIELSATYNIEVYATKANCENSDTVSVALVWVENGEVNEETGVISIPAAPVLVQGNGGILTVSGVVQNTEVVVYTIDGMEVDRAVASDGTATIYTGLQSGTIVVVKFGNKSVKVRI